VFADRPPRGARSRRRCWSLSSSQPSRYSSGCPEASHVRPGTATRKGETDLTINSIRADRRSPAVGLDPRRGGFAAGSRHVAAFTCLLFVWIAASGCNRSVSGRVAVRGTVVRGSVPVPSGSISFIPVADGPAAGTSIEAGRYEFSADDGPLPGRYRVLIRIVEDDKRARIAAGPAAGRRRESADRQQWETTLDVTADGVLQHDFDLDRM